MTSTCFSKQSKKYCKQVGTNTSQRPGGPLSFISALSSFYMRTIIFWVSVEAGPASSKSQYITSAGDLHTPQYSEQYFLPVHRSTDSNCSTCYQYTAVQKASAVLATCTQTAIHIESEVHATCTHTAIHIESEVHATSTPQYS